MRHTLTFALAFLSAFAQASLQSDVDFCIAAKSKLQISGCHVITEPIRITDPNNLENTQLVIEGTGASAQIEGWIDGPLVILDNPRRCEMRSLNIVNHVGDGVLVKSFPTPGHVGSAGNNSFYNLDIQAKGHCFKIEAVEGSDFSASSWFNCNFQGSSGMVFVGSNLLNPTLFNCTFSFCGTAVDMTKGGSDFLMVGGGFSHCATGVLCDQGYQGTTQAITVEDSGTVLELSSGPGSGFKLGISQIRSTTTLVRSATNSGSLTVDCNSVSGKPLINLTGNGGTLKLVGAASSVKVLKPSGSTVKITTAP